ncbi:triokinase/FMN cyclase-like isoform X2 [Leptopilina boulardi]|uniref:triokinase/FMN cyclase-like isoform X2 n=1 Tax=Leptopilina boulardi TaxID=63433 RepID=UPI0021F5BF03|nr:triokinase/FMN cyclase-like isoform X2 [Leptopilina boulardi]
MSKKNLINSVTTAVDESLTGLSMTFPRLDLHLKKRVVLEPLWAEFSDKVTIICGGGSGHEPFASGFVGSGMLNAAIAGSIFASPPPSHILYALKCVSINNKAGTLVIIPNYTGDCLNFAIAIEKAKVDGIKVNEVIAADDCSIPENELGRAGKRGLCGILFIMKIAGALAQRKYNLEEVTKFAKLVSQNIATYGVGLTACTLPGKGLMFEIPNDEIEFGLGVHGEAGYERKKLQNVNEIVSQILKKLIETLLIRSNDSIAIIVNNFGGLSQLETGIVVKEIVTQCQLFRIKPLRVYSGILMSSLDSVGIHISILKFPENEKEQIINCLDDSTDAPQWPGKSFTVPFESEKFSIKEETVIFHKLGKKFNEHEERLFKECLLKASQAIIDKENYINDLDRGCGDGDCGSTLKQLAEAIVTSVEDLSLSHAASVFMELSYIAEEKMGGTSGALYSLMFTLAGKELANCDNENWPQLWHNAWKTAINA